MKVLVHAVTILSLSMSDLLATNSDDFEMFQAAMATKVERPDVTSLSFNYRPQLESIEGVARYFPNLKSLRVVGCRNIKRFMPVVGLLTGLRSLHINRVGISDVKDLKALRDLEALTVCDRTMQLRSIEPLVSLPIKYLNLCGEVGIEDLELLGRMTWLEKLSLAQVFYADEPVYPPLDFLRPLDRLMYLSLACGFMIKDLSPVWDVRALQSLVLSGMEDGDCLWNLSGIENLTNMEYLALGHLLAYREPSYLRRFPKLKKLEVYASSSDLVEIRKHIAGSVECGSDLKFPGWGW